jgi:hypothetical protein
LRICSVWVPIFAKIQHATPSADASSAQLLSNFSPTMTRTGLSTASPIQLSGAQAAARYATHEDFDITIISHNTDSRSDFMVFRNKLKGSTERILVDFATVLESRVIDQVVNVNASMYLFYFTLATEENKEDGAMDQILAVVLG